MKNKNFCFNFAIKSDINFCLTITYQDLYKKNLTKIPTFPGFPNPFAIFAQPQLCLEMIINPLIIQFNLYHQKSWMLNAVLLPQNISKHKKIIK